jgi:heme-degrading monooxygenase HmoA
MFTRVVECEAKKGKSEDLTRKLRNEVLPALLKQPGFIDLIALRNGMDAERVLCLSFWDSKESAEKYNREPYNTIVNVLKPVLTINPTVETLRVEISTAHRIATSQAA